MYNLYILQGLILTKIVKTRDTHTQFIFVALFAATENKKLLKKIISFPSIGIKYVM